MLAAFSLDGVAAWIVALSALLGALALIWRHAGRPLWRFAMWVRHELREEIERRKAVDILIDRELKHNGGTSMKDRSTEAAAAARTAAEQAQVAATRAVAAAAEAALVRSKLDDMAATQAVLFTVLDRIIDQENQQHGALWAAVTGRPIEPLTPEAARTPHPTENP